MTRISQRDSKQQTLAGYYHERPQRGFAKWLRFPCLDLTKLRTRLCRASQHTHFLTLITPRNRQHNDPSSSPSETRARKPRQLPRTPPDPAVPEALRQLPQCWLLRARPRRLKTESARAIRLSSPGEPLGLTPTLQKKRSTHGKTPEIGSQEDGDKYLVWGKGVHKKLVPVPESFPYKM